MITFYHAPHSCSLAVKAALTASGAEFETKLVDFSKDEHLSAEFLQISPLGKVPAIDIDGVVLTGGAAINQFIADRFPESKLMPENGTIEKANALKWLSFVYSNLHPALARAFYPARYGKDEVSVKALSEIEVHKLIAIIDEQLGKNQYIAGDSMTLVDLYFMTAIHWESVLQKPIIATYKNIARFEQTMFSLPIVGEVYRAEYEG